MSIISAVDSAFIDKTQHPGMAWIPSGTFRMGSDKRYPEEAPVHRVTVDGLWMDTTPVTNRRFREFVCATGHMTFAARHPEPVDTSTSHGGFRCVARTPRSI